MDYKHRLNQEKNKQIYVCVYFKDLNNPCPKNDFLLPIIELMFYATTSNEVLSFMDWSLGCNQIQMAPNGKEFTVFCTPKDIYCYKVMPFRIKNMGPIYQCVMQRIFDDMLHKDVECHVNDLVVKFREKKMNHLQDFCMVFDKLRRHQLKMNPLKCIFSVTFDHFLWFIVWHSSIEVDQPKIETIRDVPESRNL